MFDFLKLQITERFKVKMVKRNVEFFLSKIDDILRNFLFYPIIFNDSEILSDNSVMAGESTVCNTIVKNWNFRSSIFVRDNPWL